MNILTSEQRLLMSKIRDGWIEVVFDTQPVDREKAEVAIRLAYELEEEELPKTIIWFDNPLDAVIWMFDHLEELYPGVNLPNIGYSSRRRTVLSNHIHWEDERIVYGLLNPDRIPKNIFEQFAANFNQVIPPKHLHWLSERFLANFLNTHLRFHLRDLWGKAKYLSKERDYRDITNSEAISMHDIYYFAASSFCHTIGYDCSEFRGYWAAAKYCGLWWAFIDTAVVVPKPQEIYVDSQYRLHAEGKPALVYKGFVSYANHGKYYRSPE